MTVIICDANFSFTLSVAKAFEGQGISCVQVGTGKECQLKIFQGKFDALIIDINTQSHSAVEVIKYVKAHKLKTRIIVTLEKAGQLEAMDLNVETLKRLGVYNMVTKPIDPEQLVKLVLTKIGFDSDQTVYANEEEIVANADEMCLLETPEIVIENIAILDYYVHTTGYIYHRVIKRGEKAAGQIDQKIFYKAKDRTLFIQFMNKIVGKMTPDEEIKPEDKFINLKSLADTYITESYTNGLNPKLVEEGKKLCQNMFALLDKEKRLKELMKMYQEKTPHHFAELFLVSFFSTIIAKSLDWNSQRTTEMVALGGLLHDIGLYRLNPEITRKLRADMTIEEEEIFKTHPLESVKILREMTQIAEPVAQIVYQHHETINGEGFPNQLSSVRIYPLAKIVSVADAFTSLLIQSQKPPIEALKMFVQNRQNIERYDANLIKSLITGFVKESK